MRWYKPMFYPGGPVIKFLSVSNIWCINDPFCVDYSICSCGQSFHPNSEKSITHSHCILQLHGNQDVCTYKFYCQLWPSLIASYSIANNCNIIIKAHLLTKVLLHHTHLHIISCPELQILALILLLIYIVHYYLHNSFLCLLTCLPVFPLLTMGEAGHKSSLREGDSALKCPPNTASSMISSSETTWWSSAFSVQMLFTTWWR